MSAHDVDRHTKTSEVGSTSLLLKDVRPALASATEPVRITNFLALKKQVLCIGDEPTVPAV